MMVELGPELSKAVRHTAVDLDCEPGEVVNEVLNFILLAKSETIGTCGYYPANTEEKGWVRSLTYFHSVSRLAWRALPWQWRELFKERLSSGLNSRGHVEWKDRPGVT